MLSRNVFVLMFLDFLHFLPFLFISFFWFCSWSCHFAASLFLPFQPPSSLARPCNNFHIAMGLMGAIEDDEFQPSGLTQQQQLQNIDPGNRKNWHRSVTDIPWIARSGSQSSGQSWPFFPLCVSFHFLPQVWFFTHLLFWKWVWASCLFWIVSLKHLENVMYGWTGQNWTNSCFRFTLQKLDVVARRVVCKSHPGGVYKCGLFIRCRDRLYRNPTETGEFVFTEVLAARKFINPTQAPWLSAESETGTKYIKYLHCQFVNFIGLVSLFFSLFSYSSVSSSCADTCSFSFDFSPSFSSSLPGLFLFLVPLLVFNFRCV